MNKYIVKNCPALYGINDGFLCVRGDESYCIDCTDCLIKQVIDKCKEARKTGKKAYLPLNILQLLDIEEVE